MPGDDKEEGTAQAVAVGGVGAVVGTIFGMLLASRPAEAAPPEEKWEYLFECLEAMVKAIEKLIASYEASEIKVSTLWVAKDPEQIFNQAIRSVGTVDSDRMVDYRNCKRLLIKVESSLDQACQIQVVGDITNSFALAVNVGAAWPCVANGNISIGLAWDDWHPYIGVRVITGVAPTAGKVDIWAVMQE